MDIFQFKDAARGYQSKGKPQPQETVSGRRDPCVSNERLVGNPQLLVVMKSSFRDCWLLSMITFCYVFSRHSLMERLSKPYDPCPTEMTPNPWKRNTAPGVAHGWQKFVNRVETELRTSSTQLTKAIIDLFHLEPCQPMSIGLGMIADTVIGQWELCICTTSKRA